MTENGRIKLYTLSTCKHCKALRSYLEEKGVAFDFVDVDLLAGPERREMIKEVRQYNQRCSFPTTVIGEKVLVGFKEEELREALGIV
jgi:glutaredoxin